MLSNFYSSNIQIHNDNYRIIVFHTYNIKIEVREVQLGTTFNIGVSGKKESF